MFWSSILQAILVLRSEEWVGICDKQQGRTQKSSLHGNLSNWPTCTLDINYWWMLLLIRLIWYITTWLEFHIRGEHRCITPKFNVTFTMELKTWLKKDHKQFLFTICYFPPFSCPFSRTDFLHHLQSFPFSHLWDWEFLSIRSGQSPNTIVRFLGATMAYHRCIGIAIFVVQYVQVWKIYIFFLQNIMQEKMFGDI